MEKTYYHITEGTIILPKEKADGITAEEFWENDNNIEWTVLDYFEEGEEDEARALFEQEFSRATVDYRYSETEAAVSWYFLEEITDDTESTGNSYASAYTLDESIEPEPRKEGKLIDMDSFRKRKQYGET